MKRRTLLWLAVPTALVAGLGFAARPSTPAEVPPLPETLEPFSLEDQHGRLHEVDAGSRLVLFSRDKDVAKWAFTVLAEREGLLAGRRAVFALDISPMPRVITWAFARPKMRKQPFPILLDAGPGPTRLFPSVEKQLTALHLDRLRVTRVEHLADPAALRAVLAR